MAYKDVDFYRVWLHDGNDDIAIVSIPVGKYLEKDEGAKVCVSSWRCGRHRHSGAGKVNGSYVNSALHQKRRHAHGYDEALTR
ncbi:MAG: hypothetical protein R2838_23650 [Caldilineaceae bacterium]